MNMLSHDEDEAGGVIASRLVTCFVLPGVLRSSVDLGLYTIIAKLTKTSAEKYVSASEITKHFSTENPNATDLVDKILFLLACNSVVSCKVIDGKRAYGLSPATKFYVDDEEGYSFAYALLNYDNADYGIFHTKITNLVLKGSGKSAGATEVKFNDEAAIYNEHFDKAMSSHTRIMMSKILDAYNGFGELESLTDVGGGVGTSLHLITTKHPSIKGVNFDLPHVIQTAKPLEGIEHVPGDMFVDIPKSQTIMMKFITHNWDDECVVKMLTKCYDALPENGKVILVDCILPFEPDTTEYTKNIIEMDIIMAVYWGGKERTKEEFETLTRKVGFSSINFQYCAYACWIIEIRK